MIYKYAVLVVDSKEIRVGSTKLSILTNYQIAAIAGNPIIEKQLISLKAVSAGSNFCTYTNTSKFVGQFFLAEII